MIRACLLMAALAVLCRLGSAQPCACYESGIDLSFVKYQEIQAGLAAKNLPYLRQISWNLFFGITRGSKCGGDAMPRFLTWYRRSDVFESANACPANTPIAAPENLELFLRQMSPEQRHALGLPIEPSHEDVRLAQAGVTFETVLFNDALVKFLRKPFQLDKAYDLTSPKDLCALGNFAKTHNPDFKSFPQAPLPDLVEPVVAAAKVVWLYVPKGQWSALPVWDSESNVSQTNFGNLPAFFTRWVAVNPNDPAPQPGETVRVGTLSGPHDALKVSFQRFFAMPVTSQLQPQVQHLLDVYHRGAKAQTGDLLLLVAMHVSSKLQQDWLWSTFWWHDRPDQEYGEDRPPTVTGVWSNYRMNIAFDMLEPLEKDHSPRICFNPYLEATIGPNVANENGTKTNCMSCHRLAALPPVNASSVTRGPVRIDNPLLVGKLPTDYIWSIPKNVSCAVQ